MENQQIIITLKEYKELRNIAEAYQELIGRYNLLAHVYNEMVQPMEEVEEKPKIGFKTK